MAHVTEQAIKAWQAGWQDAVDDIRRGRLPPSNIGNHPHAYILGYMEFRIVYALLRVSITTAAEEAYDTSLSHFMENYDL